MLSFNLNSYTPSNTGGYARQATQATQARQARGYVSPFRPAVVQPRTQLPAFSLPSWNSPATPKRPAPAPVIVAPRSVGTPGLKLSLPTSVATPPRPTSTVGRVGSAIGYAFRSTESFLPFNFGGRLGLPAPRPARPPAPAPAPAPAGPPKEKHESRIIQREIDKRDALKEKRDQLRKQLRNKSNEAQREWYRNGESRKLDREVRRLERELARTARDYYRARAEVEKLKRIYENPDRFRFQPRQPVFPRPVFN
ncbi:MAG: hypothetical protein AAF333_09330 [Planctomycetota bacterium]